MTETTREAETVAALAPQRANLLLANPCLSCGAPVAVHDESRWTPLSQRRIPRPEATLVDGVPDYLAGPLMRWLGSYLRDRPKLTERIALHLRVALDDQDAERFAAGLRADDPVLLLDAIDVALHLDKSFWWDLDVAGPMLNMAEASLASWIPDTVWPKDSQAREVERLDELLEDAGSAFTVDWKERCLRRRVATGVALAAEQAMSADPGGHLRDALAAIYGRHPDPAKAYDEAVRAVEAAAIPLVLPKGKAETLGKVLRHFEDAPDKWVLAIQGDGGNIAALAAMIKMLWRGHVARHSGGPDYRPQRQDEAEMAVHLAATLVQWFTSGAVQPRSSS
jgi:hypothetical protein